MFTIFLTPYFILLAMDMPFWAYLLLNVVIGIGMAGVGMNVMHDGNHGSYSTKSWVNKIMGGSIYILAGNVYNWQVQHNVLHHTYTNILGHEEDLEAGCGSYNYVTITKRFRACMLYATVSKRSHRQRHQEKTVVYQQSPKRLQIPHL